MAMLVYQRVIILVLPHEFYIQQHNNILKRTHLDFGQIHP